MTKRSDDHPKQVTHPAYHDHVHKTDDLIEGEDQIISYFLSCVDMELVKRITHILEETTVDNGYSTLAYTLGASMAICGFQNKTNENEDCEKLKMLATFLHMIMHAMRQKLEKGEEI